MTAFLGLREQRLPARLKPYRYESLVQPREVRFIKVLPSDQKNTEIFCAFLHAVIPEDGEATRIVSYEALSYSWGYPVLTETIYIRHRGNAVAGLKSGWSTFKVTRELYSALRALRHGSETRTMWIDAICIDQSNPQEKADQILLMRQIYSRAERVPIWLGGERDTSPGLIKSCINACEELCKLIEQEKDVSPDAEPSDRVITAVTIFSRASQSSPAERWTAITKLFGRPWFRRTWVIQEAVLARDMVFMWGAHTIGWNSLYTVAAALKIAYFYMILPIEEIVESIHSLIIIDAYKKRMGPSEAEYPDDRVRSVAHLSMLLIGTRNFLTSFGHDKIYGILGLIPANEYSQIRPDYDQSVEHHYWQTALLLIGTGFFGTIASVWWRKDPSKSKLPSWVTDFHQAGTPRDSLHKQSAYHATKNSEPAFRFSDDFKKLLIRGKIIDKVSVVGEEFLPTSDGSSRESEPDDMIIASHLRMVSSLMKSFDMFYKNVVCPDPELENALRTEDEELFARLLTCDIHAGGEKLTEAEEVIALKEFEAFKSYHGSELKAPWYSVEAPSPEFTRMFFDAGYFAGRVQTWVRGRTFFVSEKKLAGWAPPCVRPGDVVCLLFGFSVPFILRSVDKHAAEGDEDSTKQQYYLLGECYLHGMMDGEAMDDAKISETEFTIV